MMIENVLLMVCLLGWFTVIVAGLIDRERKILLSWIVLGLQLAVMVFRVVVSGHLPFSNIYESLVFFSFLYGAKLVFLRHRNRELSPLLLLPAVLLLLITLFMPEDHKDPSSLMPALKSLWFYIHVPSIFIGYVSVTFAFALSFFKSEGMESMMASEIKQGFFFLSAGIITGAFWGAQSWTRFWSWDPKEVWALITWLLLCGALHIKHRKGRRLLLYTAFGALLFTYFGVTYILPGLHSYL